MLQHGNLTPSINAASTAKPADNENRLEGLNFRRFFEATPSPCVAILPDAPRFTIVAVNDSYLAATGTQRDDMLNRGLFEVFPDNPNDPQATGVSDLRISLERVIQERKPDVMGVQKYDIPRRDGEEQDFEVKYWSPVNIPICDANDTVSFIIHRVEDVTEFMLLRERSSEESATIEKVQAQADRMQAEVLQSTHEVKEANRQLKSANEKLERRELELAQLNERLKELDQAKTRFFNNVSHEFRTPLTLMLAPIDDARQDPHTIPENRERMEMAYRNTLRLLKLVNNLLDFARIEAGRAQVAYQPTSLSSYTAELASMFRSAIEKAGLRFNVDCQPLPQLVYVDRDMWEKIVLNLLSNAFKHTFDGAITVRLRWKEDHVELTVQDTGVGIPAEQVPHLFERFYRAPNARSRTLEGAGIGLALVHELVKLHGGTITVNSEVGRGSVFMVSIPTGISHLPSERIESETEQVLSSISSQAYVEEALRWLPEETAQIVAERNERTVWRKSNGDVVRLLLADDNADMRDYVYRLLEPYCEIETVSDGKAALFSAQRQRPDLILSDIMMPKLDGFALLSALKEDVSLKNIPVILLSARAGEEAKVEGLQAGADDYLVKPFNADELLARVKANLHLELQRARQEAEDAKRFSEDLLRTVTNNASSSLLFMDAEQRCTYANPAFERMSGYTFKEMEGRIPHEVIHCTHPDGSQFFRFECPINQALSEHHAAQGYEAIFLHKDGHPYNAICNAEPIFENGLPIGTVVEMRDITEEKLAEEAIHRFNEELEQKVNERTIQLQALNKELETFSYSVSHDLRAPLRGIDGFSQLLFKECAGQLDEKANHYLERIRQSAQKMAELIDDMLALSRLTRREMFWEHTDLSLTAKEIAQELREQEPDRQVEFLISEGLLARGDKGLLESALRNLLGNAWKYTSRHDTARIEFGQTEHNGKRAYFVKDDGAGFDMRYVDKLFGVFQRLHRVDEFPGTGVGLASVARIIHRHGGEVWAEAQLEQGATFYFTLG